MIVYNVKIDTMSKEWRDYIDKETELNKVEKDFEEVKRKLAKNVHPYLEEISNYEVEYNTGSNFENSICFKIKEELIKEDI